VWVGQLMVEQIRQLVEESEIMKEDDEKWPKKNVVGRQELEIRLGNEHISFDPILSEEQSRKLILILAFPRRPN
jgi:GrpB-like predicted nucleotidyltransferase (UPF0157 family)